MELKTESPKIYIMCGKARHGKTTVANFMKEYLKEKGIKHIDLTYSMYIKEYAKKISDWDGNEDTKPRELLQQLGTDIIRTNLGDEFFIKRIIDDIKVYSYFFDVVIIIHITRRIIMSMYPMNWLRRFIRLRKEKKLTKRRNVTIKRIIP